jgi:chain length determinant protein EpsF
MTLGQFFSILRARWLLIALIFSLTVVLTVGISMLLPKKYTATASVVVDFKPDPLSAAMYGAGLASPAFMATQVDIIQSDRVAQRVVRNLKLADNPQVRANWQEATKGQGTVESWLATQFSKEMDVVPSRESSVININYKGADPRFAAGLANAFAQSYIETALELRVDPARQYSTFFDTRSKESREALEKAQTKLSAYQKENSIIASDERLDVENARLNELSSQLVALQALSAESGSRQAQANSSTGANMPEVLNNALITQIKADISRGEARLQELGARYGDSHPQVIEAKANLNELRSKLESETRKVTGSVGITNTVTRQREADVRASLESQRAKVLRMKAVRDEMQVLSRDVENAQRAYDSVFARLNQTSMESQSTQSNINILSSAVPPLEPSSPRLVLNTLLSIIVGLLLAVAVALLRELFDRRIRAVDDAAISLGLPVLGVMPKPGSKLLRGRQGSEMQRRLMAPLPTAKEA